MDEKQDKEDATGRKPLSKRALWAVGIALIVVVGTATGFLLTLLEK